MTPDAIKTALDYHERTKHKLARYARGPGYLDWETQPDPFRVYKGAPRVLLPLAGLGPASLYEDVYRPGAIPARTVDRNGIAALFELALGLSAWKEHSSARWALRCNPSSGNLHPTEGYLIAPATDGIEPGVYHYISRDHALERRAVVSPEDARSLASMLPPGGALVGLSSIHWREAWKYGERAFRYCQHDAGHAIAAIRYAAAALGWSALLLDDLSDDHVAALLGIDRADDFDHLDPADREHPDAILVVAPAPIDPKLAGALCAEADRAVHIVSGATWTGRANALSSAHMDWPIIDEVAAATHKPPTRSPVWTNPIEMPSVAPSINNDATAASIFRRRRSAVSMDGETSIDASALYRALDRLLPRKGVPPWDAIPWPPQIHPVLFVHRVRGLEPGLYALERSPAIHDRLRSAMHPEFEWIKPPDCPDHLAFYQLIEADLRQSAQIVSCHQDIAADGAFSLGMVADFEEPIRGLGAWFYRRLFWEAGALGHVLYLEAEAITPIGSIRSTGIGCYFDDSFHEICGFKDATFQSLYHFTVGGPVDDPRLQTRPPYAHLGDRPIIE